MDEGKPDSYENEADDEGHGAGMMDSAQFTSATFYHYVALNLDMLTKRFPDPVERKVIVTAFTEAFVKAIRERGEQRITRTHSQCTC